MNSGAQIVWINLYGQQAQPHIQWRANALNKYNYNK